VVVQAGVHHQRAEHKLGDNDAGARRDPAHQQHYHTARLHHERIRLLRRRQEGDAGGGDAGRRRDMAGVPPRPPGEAQQVRQVLVLVLLVRRGGGPRPARRQGDRRARMGPVAQHPAREAHMEPH
ncbi:hypothetical protein ACJX0J_020092, partial [Zea mays]